MRFRKPKKITDPREVEEHWRQAFPDPKQPRYSHEAVMWGMKVGGTIGFLVNGVFMYFWLTDRYGFFSAETLNQHLSHTHHRPHFDSLEMQLLFLGLCCLPGLLGGGALGAFIGSRLKLGE